MEPTKYAVRWCLNEAEKMYNERWSKWHYTDNGNETGCKRQIPVAGNGCRFLPETDEMLDRVDCGPCLRYMKTML